MKYAVLRVNGKQYKAREGEEILVDKMLDLKAEPEVLMIVDEDKVSVGTPILTDTKVVTKVVEPEVKGIKVDVLKYKAKSRYRKHTGFRAVYTKLLVEKIA